MKTITIELDKDQDLSAVEEGLHKMGLKFHVAEEDDDEDWGDLPESVIESIKAGLADSEAGKLIPHEEVMVRMAKRLKHWQEKNG